jgi:anti-sigma factor RsiW
LSDSNHRNQSPPEWVTCKHSISLLVDYQDGTLAPEEARKLERHFKACPPCIDFVRKYKSTSVLCRRALVDEVPEDMAKRLKAFLQDKIKTS